ncbi:uncharacterized protein LOC124665651 [Lolium rigidum]|uniref:uncharacterized protein LOC124665651 n=1 Tax=Lolium rigidum TaxID=89674 RepID=UPI001F5D15FA|nr:uncharacterized protein LOC124665651 [Lolium rigidum]XP_047059003.1 uncharacterized protein LOC124665651 [Lolium rigidum]
MGKEDVSMAGRKETASEKNPFHTDVDVVDVDDDDDEDEAKEVFREGGAAAVFGNGGVISVLFETPSGFTPSGFAIFGYDAINLAKEDAWKHIWADFIDVPKTALWMEAFKTFEVKGSAITDTSVSPELSSMIQKYVVDEQTLAVGNEKYKDVIQKCLKIPCVYTPAVKELMWGLRIQMPRFLPVEKSEMANEDRFPMSEGMIFLLNYHDFDINRHMMVTKRIIEVAGIVYECDCRVNKYKYDNALCFAAHQLKKISRICTRRWDLLKLATALKMICYPEYEISDARQLFSKRHLKRLMKDAPRYRNKIPKNPCMRAYKEMYSARKIRLNAASLLVRLVKQAKKAYEDDQAGKAGSDCEIGPGKKKICRSFDPVMIDDHELTKCHTTVPEKRREGQVPPTLAPVDTQISSHPVLT